MVRDGGGLLQVLGHEGVTEAVVERHGVLVVGHLDEVEQALRALGDVHLAVHVLAEGLDLLQDDERRHAQVVVPQEPHAPLRARHGLHHHVVQRAARGGDGDVELRVDGAQVAQAAA